MIIKSQAREVHVADVAASFNALLSMRPIRIDEMRFKVGDGL